MQKQLQAMIRAIVESPEPTRAFNVRASMEEAATHMSYLEAVGFVGVDDVTDIVTVTTDGRLFAGLKPDGVPDLPVEVAAVTGNIEERELVARYMEGKIAAIDMHLAAHAVPEYSRTMSWEEAYQHCAITLKCAADEFRQGLHLPSKHIEGRVIPYNEDRSTGIRHQANLAMFFTDIYQRNVKAGWWTDIKTGLPKKRSVGELFMLMVTEIAEAYKAYIFNENDDKLPQYPGLGVEMADLGIRWADFCGALLAGNLVYSCDDVINPGDSMFQEICEIAERYEAIRKTPEAVGDPETGDHMPAQDVAVMIDAKLDYNATRADHKIENRLKEGGKQT